MLFHSIYLGKKNVRVHISLHIPCSSNPFYTENYHLLMLLPSYFWKKLECWTNKHVKTTEMEGWNNILKQHLAWLIGGVRDMEETIWSSDSERSLMLASHSSGELSLWPIYVTGLNPRINHLCLHQGRLSTLHLLGMCPFHGWWTF